MSMFGFYAICTDNGASFVSAEFKEFGYSNEIELVTIPTIAAKGRLRV